MTGELLEPPTADPAVASGREDVFVLPCSVSQKRFWMLEQLSPGNTALLIPIALRLRGSLQIESLERALRNIVARHEILRTRFAQVDGEPCQVLSENVDFHLRRLDGSQVPESEREGRIVQLMSEEAGQPIALDRAPLLRATLAELGGRDYVLMLTAHHIISDGWSSGVLVRELGAGYAAQVRNCLPELPPLDIQYGDYVLWQDEWLKSPELDRQVDYWRQQLLGTLPVLDIPTDFARGKAAGCDAVLESLLLPAHLSEALREYCRVHGVTLFMLLCSAYLVLLHRHTGQEDLLIGTTGANRNRPELENLIGLFANILLLRVKVDGAQKFADFLREQRGQLLESFAHSEAPLEYILEQISQGPTRSSKVQLQTHFLFQKAFMQASEAGGLEIKPLYSVSPGSTFELAFGIVERGEGIRLQMEYHTGLFRQETIARLLRHFQALLESIVENGDLSINELSLFPGNEREEEEARAARALESSTAGGPIALSSLIADLDRQLEAHLQADAAPFCPVRELPPGLAVMVLDPDHRLLPPGLVGEVYVAGPIESAVSFDPASPDCLLGDVSRQRPRFATGFQGRLGSGGQVELWGRGEDLVRTPFRINRRLFDVRLRLHYAVQDVRTVLQKNSTRLVMFVVAKKNTPLTGNELLTFLRAQLKGFDIPAAIVLVDQFPANEEAASWLQNHPAPNPETELSVPLQGVMHQQLREIWKSILQTSAFGMNDNFFDLGGNSFLALRMMKEAEKLAGRPLPLSLLFSGATIAELARSITTLRADSEADLDLIPVQIQGTRPPLFFLHGDWVGGGFYCQRLSRQLGEDQPFFALPPHRAAEKLLTLAEMARHHVAALRREAPHGPYLIGGYCIGALVAMEVARTLLNQGEKISRLLLIDPPFWADRWLRAAWPSVDRLGRLRGWSIEKKIRFFDRYVVSLQRSLRRRTQGGNTATLRPSDAALPADAEVDKILDGPEYSLYFLAYRLHKIPPLAVPTSVFFSESTSDQRVAGLIRLGHLDSAQTRIYRIPGDHTTCVTEDVSLLAVKMREALAQT